MPTSSVLRLGRGFLFWRVPIRVVVSIAGIALTATPALCQEAGKDALTIETEDPRDAKLRDLEARLAATERKLSIRERKQSRRLDKDLPPDDEDSDFVAATLAQQEQP